MVDRASLPAEFFDITSAQLLIKPEPQYIMAQLALRALAASLPIPDGMGHIGREISGVGAPYGNEAGNFMLEDEVIAPSLFAATVNMSGLPGHTVRFNRPLFTNSTYTDAAREVGTDTTISTTGIAVASEQTTMTLKRYAGPVSAATTRPAPYPLDKLDSQLGVHKMSQIAGTHLKRDYNRWLDTKINGLNDLGANLYPKSGYTSKNNFTTGSDPLDYEFIAYAERVMNDANLPTLPDGKRLLIVPPVGTECLKLDPSVQRMQVFHKELNMLYPGAYLSTVGRFHVFESTTLSTETSSGSGTPTVYRATAIAPGCLGIGMGEAPHVAYSNDDNYGETAKVIWLAYMAFANLDTSFSYNLRFTDRSRA